MSAGTDPLSDTPEPASGLPANPQQLKFGRLHRFFLPGSHTFYRVRFRVFPGRHGITDHVVTIKSASRRPCYCDETCRQTTPTPPPALRAYRSWEGRDDRSFFVRGWQPEPDNR